MSQRRTLFASAYLLAVTLPVAPALGAQATISPSVQGEAANQASTDVPQTLTSDAPNSGPGVVAEVVVVGSRIASSTPALDGALPVTIINKDAIAASGSQTIADLLLKVPQMSGARTERDGDGSARSTLNLRGLGDQYTLVLVNGRRFSANEAANVNAIPVNAIERIEILESGAGAVYGSDAVAGVVNIVLKSSQEGASAYALHGNVTEGDAPVLEGGFTLGSASDMGNYFIAVNYYKRDPLLQVARDITLSNDARSYGGRDLRSTFNNPARIGAFLPGQPAFIVLNTDQVGAGQAPTSATDFRAYDFERDAHDRAPSGTTEIAGTERTSFLFSADRLVGSTKASIFAEAIYAFEKTLRGDGSKTVQLSDPTIGGVPATNPYNVFGVDINTSFQWRPLDVRGPEVGPGGTTGTRSDVDRETARFTLGVRENVWEEWNIELSAALYAETAVAMEVNSISRNGLRAALRRTGPDALNPFCNLCNTPAQYGGVRVDSGTTTEFGSPSFQLSTSGAPFTLPAGDVNLAAGLEYRDETYKFQSNALLASGDLVDTPTRTSFDLRRSIRSAYLELKAPLLAHESSRPALELGLAARYEDYSDFGNSTRPLVSLRWDPTPSIAVRAAYGESFRAPYLEQIAPFQAFQEVVVLDPVTGQNVEAQAVTGGNPDLSSEEAETITFGVILKPLEFPLRLAVDYFNIEQTGVIIGPSPQAVISGLVPGNVFRGPGIGFGGEDVVIEALFTNIAGRNLEGIDLQASYDLSLPENATLSLSLASSYLLKMEADSRNGQGFVDFAGEYSIVSQSSGFGGLPQLRGNLSASYARGGLTLASSVFYVDDYLDARQVAADPTNPRTIDSYVTVDAFAAYDFGRDGISSPIAGLSLQAGVENVFDEQPPFVLATNTYDRGLADVRGRYYFVSAAFRF